MKPTRLNKYLALSSDLSRRSADTAIQAGRVTINDQPANTGDLVQPTDIVCLDGKPLTPPGSTQTIMLHKPVGYICSRDGQGSPTIYELLPDNMLHLNPVGRLDKDSSGLLLLTNDGQLAHQLTHPSFQKQKVYLVSLKSTLTPEDARQIMNGVELEDGPSRLDLTSDGSAGLQWQITMHEGRNRQIRRTFERLGYQVQKLHRVEFGPYKLGKLAEGSIQEVK